MKKRIALLVVLALVLSVVLMACERVPTDSFNGTWSYDENYHWHDGSCGREHNHNHDVNGKGAHHMVPVAGSNREECDVCGYSRVHQCVLSDKYSCNEHAHWRETLCGHVLENAAPHNFVNGVCSECGYCSSITQVMLQNLAKSDIWNYALVINDLSLSNIDTLSDVDLTDAKISAELKLAMSSDLKLEGLGSVTVTSSQLASALTMQAVIENGMVYACADDVDGSVQYLCCSVEELLEESGVDFDELTANVAAIDSYSTQIIEYAKLYKQILGNVQSPRLVTVLDGLLKAVPNTDTDNTLSLYAIDFNVLRQANNLLAATTVKEYADSVYGAGFYDNLPAMVEGLFNKTVNDALVWLEKEYGITLDVILAFADKLISEFYPNPGINTVEQWWEAVRPMPIGSFKDVIKAMKPLTFKTLLTLAQTDNSVVITVEDIVENISAMCQQIKNKTLYELMLEGETEITPAMLKLSVDCLADTLENRIEVIFSVDNDNVLQNVEITVMANAESAAIPDDATEDELAVYNAFAQINAMLDNISGSVVLQRNFDLAGDYSNVVAAVKAALQQAA